MISIQKNDSYDTHKKHMNFQIGITPLPWIPTIAYIADFFTKGHTIIQFSQLLSKLLLYIVHSF